MIKTNTPCLQALSYKEFELFSATVISKVVYLLKHSSLISYNTFSIYFWASKALLEIAIHLSYFASCKHDLENSVYSCSYSSPNP